MPNLKLALIHSTAGHKQAEVNRENLLEHFHRAGEAGAQLVLAPELAVSGYSFSSREDIAPYTETADGPTLRALAALTRAYGFYACVGLAECDPLSTIYYNTAFVLGPNGELVCRYRKINAEHRWACPGNPRADNTFETPWGRVGVLICSDTYHSLMPRITALRGADLLLIPANWPPTGLDPREIWRARALENGVYVAACNRTGIDLSMDCRQAPSTVFNPQGAALLDCCHPATRLLQVDLPLNGKNSLASAARLQRLATRRMADSSDCYLNLSGIADLTEFLHLPKPGPLTISCPVPASGEHPVAALKRACVEMGTPGTLHILPAHAYEEAALDRVRHLCAEYRHKVVLARRTGSRSSFLCFDGDRAPNQWPEGESDAPLATALPRWDSGPARVLLAPLAALRHPELILAAAKQGCDLAVASTSRLSAEDRLLAGARTIDNLAVAICARNGAGIWTTPEGHQRWEEQSTQPGITCRYLLNTARTRIKRFQDRVDFERLLAV